MSKQGPPIVWSVMVICTGGRLRDGGPRHDAALVGHLHLREDGWIIATGWITAPNLAAEPHAPGEKEELTSMWSYVMDCPDPGCARTPSRTSVELVRDMVKSSRAGTSLWDIGVVDFSGR